jgi:putative cell wall-binding protein
VVRISGADRDLTAVAVSQAAFTQNGSAAAVVLASDSNFPDALAGTPLAAAKNAPLLLTPPAGLTAAVQSEIQRVAPPGSTVYILGGTGALSPTVDAQVNSLGDVPQRLAGQNRAGTAVAVAGALGNPATVLEATGLNFPDALSAGAAAIKAGAAVLLTDGTTQAPETAAYRQAHPGDATAIGGPAAGADPGATPIVGSDRYATSAMVAQHFFPAPPVAGFASALAFPDALSGGAPTGKSGGPVVLVPACGAVPSPVSGYLAQVKSGVGSATLFGGTAAVGDDVLAELEQAA